MTTLTRPLQIAWISVIIFSLTMATPTRAGTVVMTPNQETINLGLYVDILIDIPGRLTIDDLASAEIRNQFQPNHSNLISIPPGIEAVWVRFDTVRSRTSDTAGSRILEIANTILPRVDLYRPDPQLSGKYNVSTTGKKYPPQTREVAFRNCAFELSGQGSSYYLRLCPMGPEVITLRLFTKDAFQKYAMYDYFKYGLVYGVLLSMILYNLFIWVSLKDRIYLIYVLNMLSFLAYFLVFNGQLLLLVDLGPFLAPLLEWIFLPASIFFSIQFCRLFLNTRIHTPLGNKLLLGFQTAAVGVFVLGLFRYFGIAAVAANLIGMFGPLNLSVFGVIRYRQGFSPAIYYILATTFFILSSFIYVGWLMGLLPLDIPGQFIFNLGPALEAVFLSFALADRIRILQKEKRTLAQRSDLYKKASETDGLTGLFNKKYMLDKLEREVRAMDGTTAPLSFIIMDVDNFKNYNDTHGHPEGDKVLTALARVIRSCIRNIDCGCRYGGEEFAVILPQTGLENALGVAERIRVEFASLIFSPGPKMAISSSISVGVVQRQSGETPAGMIQRADQALYQAKNQGKNRVIGTK